MAVKAISTTGELVLRAVAQRATAADVTPEEIAAAASLPLQQTVSTLAYLAALGAVRERVAGAERVWHLTRRARRYVEEGNLPEAAIWAYLGETGGSTIAELRDAFSPSEVKYALYHLPVVHVDDVIKVGHELPTFDLELLELLEGVTDTRQVPDSPVAHRAIARRLVKSRRAQLRRYAMTELGLAFLERRLESEERVFTLGKGRRLHLERRHPAVHLSRFIRRVLEADGFVEVPAPPLESELWNTDVLFVPRHHNIRSRHTLACADLRGSISEAEAKVRSRLAAEFSGGGSSQSRGFGSSELAEPRVVLRSHGTASVIKWLASSGQRVAAAFAISHCCRAHWKQREFMQLDLLVADPTLTVAKMLGTVTRLLRQLRPDDPRPTFSPAHFPFTHFGTTVSIQTYRRTVAAGATGLLRAESVEALALDTRVGIAGFQLERLSELLFRDRKAGRLAGLRPRDFDDYRLRLHG